MFWFLVFFFKCTFWTVVLFNLHGFEGVDENGSEVIREKRFWVFWILTWFVALHSVQWFSGLACLVLDLICACQILFTSKCTYYFDFTFSGFLFSFLFLSFSCVTFYIWRFYMEFWGVFKYFYAINKLFFLSLNWLSRFMWFMFLVWPFWTSKSFVFFFRLYFDSLF